MSEMSENDVKEAFDAYRSEPGGEVRLDTASITTAGRRRVRRNRLLTGVAGIAVGAVLIGVAIPIVNGNNDNQSVSVADAPGKPLPPDSGRSMDALFADARGWQPDGKAKAGGAGNDTAAAFLTELGAAWPANADTAWRPSENDPKQPGARFALLTWVDGGKSAEGLLTVDPSPVTALIFPPPYQVCSEPQAPGKSCSVREVKGKGWLKETRETVNGTQVLRVSLQGDDGPAVEFRISQGAATKAGLVAGKEPLGRFPVDAAQIGKAILEIK